MIEIGRTIRNYLARSAGNGNHPSDHTIRRFIGMIETCEADLSLFRRIGGDWLVERIETQAKEIGSNVH